jgi:hypothetical protein
VDRLVEANVSEKCTVSIFRAEVTMLGIRGIIYGGRKGSLFYPSDSQHGHFRPEDGDSTLLRNVGFY